MPQGSVLDPLLWNLVYDRLRKVLDPVGPDDHYEEVAGHRGQNTGNNEAGYGPVQGFGFSFGPGED